MYISRVRVENVRGFSDRRNVDLTLTRPDGSYAGWTVLAGRNGSGKTSLLRAIALTVGGVNIASNLIPDFRTWMTFGAQTGSTELRIEASADDFQAGNGPRASDLDIQLFWMVDRDREMSRPGSQPIMAGSYDVDVKVPSSIALTPWQADPIGWFCAAYGPFRRLVGGSAETQEPKSGVIFEVQFHTQASIEAKELTHEAYERIRGMATDAELRELRAFQRSVNSQVPVPPGVTEVNDYPPAET